MCTVITPTWRRHDRLMNGTIPSVQAQTYQPVEHVVVSDGPDPELAFKAGILVDQGCWPNVVYRELPEHDPLEHWGHHARLAGIEASTGEYITYCDDDDTLRPEHCALMVAALEIAPEAGFAVSRMIGHGGPHKQVVGWGRLSCGNVGTPMICHRREILQHGTWGPASFTEDWDLVQRWLDAGVPYVNVDAETADVWPSLFHG